MEQTMNWAAKFDPKNADQISALRSLDQAQVCSYGADIWVSGSAGNKLNEVERLLRSLPCERFDVVSETQLVRPGNRVPVAELPTGRDATWTPIENWIELSLPASKIAQGSVQRVPLKLVRSNTIREANLVVSTIEALQQFAETAPQFRLEPLSFVVNMQREAIVRGLPLPSIPGRPYVESEGIASPVGMEWSPHLSAKTVRDAYEVASATLLILHSDNSWETIEDATWTPAKRSAIRLS
jgi:hypothetical protein